MQLTARDAARLLGVSEATLEKWLKGGELPATRVNDQYRLNRIDLLEFAATRNMGISAELLAELEQTQLPSLADAIRAGGVHHGRPRGRQGEHPEGGGGPPPPAARGGSHPGPPHAPRARGARLDRLRERRRHPAPAQPHRAPREAARGGDLLPRAAGRLRGARRQAGPHAGHAGQPLDARRTCTCSRWSPRRSGTPASRAALEAHAGVDALVTEVARIEAGIAARRAGAASDGARTSRRWSPSAAPGSSPWPPPPAPRWRSRWAAPAARSVRPSAWSRRSARCARRRSRSSSPGRCRTARWRSGSTRSRRSSPRPVRARAGRLGLRRRLPARRTSAAVRSGRSSSRSISSSPRWGSSSRRGRRCSSWSPGRS